MPRFVQPQVVCRDRDLPCNPIVNLDFVVAIEQSSDTDANEAPRHNILFRMHGEHMTIIWSFRDSDARDNELTNVLLRCGVPLPI